MAPQPAVTWSVLAPANGVTVANGLVTASTTLGLVRVVAANGSLRDTAEVNVVDFVPVDIKVNCGDNGPGYVPGWVGDLQFAETGHQGSWWPGTDSWVVDVSGVTNPAPHDVYCRMRGATWYSLPTGLVPPGSYKVRLHFMEPYSTESTSPRAMTANIEGAQVMTGFRILTAAGGALYKAVVREFDVTVNGDGIQIQIGGTSAMIQGFEVISSGSLARQLTLLDPLGGATYEVGQVLTVRWSGLTSGGGIGIEMSPDGGSNWYDIVGHGIPTSDPDWGTYRWTIPATVGSSVSTVSTNVLVRIYKYTDKNGVNDVSPSPVTIGASSTTTERASLARFAAKAWAERLGGGLRINVPWQGSHTVELFSPDGRRVAVMQGRGAQQYSIAGEEAAAGCLIVRITGGGKTVVERVVGGR
jgi:hypothetical protein